MKKPPRFLTVPQAGPDLSLFVPIETAAFFSFVTVDFFLTVLFHA
jgi:hypothetical protein